jgi:methionyl-tRNA formyltransferase
MARIDWTNDAATVSQTIRAFDPKPGAFAMSKSGEVKLFGAVVASAGGGWPAGEVLSIDDEGMIVACGAGSIRVDCVQPAGKRRISPLEWSRGRGVTPGERLS